MNVTEETIREELEWKEEMHEVTEEKLADSINPEDFVPQRRMLALAARGMGICELLLGNESTGSAWFGTAVEHYLSFCEGVIEHRDSVEQSHFAHRPTNYQETIDYALLAGDEGLIHRAIQLPLDLEENRYLDEWGDWEFHHVLYYIKALAHTLDDDPETARSYLQKLDAVDHDHENYDALHDALLGIVDGNRDEFLSGVSDLLAWHDDAYGHDLSTASHFICVDATALLVLARQEDMDIGPDEFDDDLGAYLPEALFE